MNLWHVSGIIFLWLSGCAAPVYIPPASADHYQHELSAWTGQDVKSMSQMWGAPSSTEVMSDGSQRVGWNNHPKWGCTTLAVTNSSGTILSWDFKGGSCVTAYTDQEMARIQANLNALRKLAPSLKRGNHLLISFYPGAVDLESHPATADLDCYFVSYSRFYEEITVRATPQPKHGFTTNTDRVPYEMRYIRNITIQLPNH